MSHVQNTEEIDRILRMAPALPVLAIDSVEQALKLTATLADAGLPVVEITLRTAAALPAIAAISKQLPHVLVTAGTVLSDADMAAVKQAGAVLAISPGCTDALYSAAAAHRMAFLPGVASASDIQRGREQGYRRFKLFPATVAGGIDALKAFAGPFADVKFCPTGGIHLGNAAAFLAMPNVLTVGGSWMVDKTALANADYAAISQAARACAALRSAV
jgi:2-dehydro-3-deoxyphosphogluconate aldolase / (4S)-4-hydroxy-2-oxoglutarate aldolase